MLRQTQPRTGTGIAGRRVLWRFFLNWDVQKVAVQSAGNPLNGLLVQRGEQRHHDILIENGPLKQINQLLFGHIGHKLTERANERARRNQSRPPPV